MAALSCYQPARSHLAQPARCLDEDEEESQATFSLRRRQFIERCHEARARPREPPAQPPPSVHRTREELTKHAPAPAPLNRRRVTVESGWSKVEEVRRKFESGWSKVEEVRKKFEGAAASNNYSRSFESPPRRRLADSLFASFKLPRRKDGGGMASRPAPAQQKRKSAVELLAETKAYYVKSETVLDRKQELPLRQNQISSGLQGAIAAGGCRLISSGALNNDSCCNPYATTRLPATRRAVSAGDGLQHTLRKLIEPADDSVYAVPKKPPVKVTPQMLSMMPSPYKKDGKLVREVIVRPYGFGDAVLLPDEFFVPRKKHEVDAMPIPNKKKGSDISPEKIVRVNSVLSDGEPAEVIAYGPLGYKEAHRYMRSNSHSQPSMREEDGGMNINSHKSLPDLHAQARCYPERENMGAGDSCTVGRSPRRRRSPHQRTASCSSKGTRSNHSSLMSSCEAFSEHPSPGEENYQSYNSRCGSSFARDSGGSSGHYTQRSAPPHPPPPHHPHPHRTDSGSSTQHEHSRYGLYYAEECYSPQLEGVVVCAPPQFQDGAPSPPPAPPPLETNANTHLDAMQQPRVGIHFQASAPPPQFQDDPPQYDYNEYECGYKSNKCVSLTRKEREYRERDYNRYHEQTSELMRKEPQYAETRQPRARIDDTQDYVNTIQMCPGEEVTSPLGTFKRQRCLRYKQRRPRPILRSKSDISDRYRRSDGRSPASAPCEGEDSPDSPSSESSRLHQFFSRLGLEARQYDALYRDPPPDSPVFFSSASTIDSNQLATVDYTVQGPGGGAPKPIYRNTEPPSVVERNARIIKWLCQCRKTQLPPPPQTNYNSVQN